MRRVDFEKDGYHVDDVAISGKLIEMFRLERMGREDFWAAIYFSDGTDLTFSIYGRSLSVAAEFGGEPIAKATPPPTSHVKEGS
jgi:hypothetical protein